MGYTKADFHRMKCENCGMQPFFTDPYRRIEVDHIVPLNHPTTPGRDVEENWQPLCGRCNRYKSNMTNEEARNATTMPDGFGRELPWPRGFDWATETWDDGSLVDWVHGQLFSFPIRVALLAPQYAEAK